MERQTGKIRGTFSRMHKALDGWMLAIARRLHQLKASTTMDLGISIFYCCTTVYTVHHVMYRMLGIKGSAEHSRWTCVDRPSCSVDKK